MRTYEELLTVDKGEWTHPEQLAMSAVDNLVRAAQKLRRIGYDVLADGADNIRVGLFMAMEYTHHQEEG
jgi:hypothetical protein